MKCTNDLMKNIILKLKILIKKASVPVLAAAVLLFTSACGKVEVLHPFDLYGESAGLGIVKTLPEGGHASFFSADLCVTDGGDMHTEMVPSSVCASAAAFNLSTLNTLYKQNIYGRIYPASTTKIMTCLVALKYGNLSKMCTVSERACDQPSDSSVAHLYPGDVISLQDLLYGLMLVSGNDAAIAVAECVGGDVETFVDMMNKEAMSLGATSTHFVNPNGLHDEDHYTTAYDMYLIMNEAVKTVGFVDIISCPSKTVNYVDVNGAPKEHTYTTTNQYLSGKKKTPDNVTVVGGKTGTTGAAGYCLVLLAKNERDEDVVSLVFDADCRSNLYLMTSEILSSFSAD